MADVPTPVRFVAQRDVDPKEAPGCAGGYQPGDVAGFPAGFAAALIASGVAVSAPIAGLAAPAPLSPDPSAALAAASAEISRIGSGPMNPQAAATLAAEAPAHFAAGKAEP